VKAESSVGGSSNSSTNGLMVCSATCNRTLHDHHIRFWYLSCCGCPRLRGRQHLATPHTRSPCNTTSTTVTTSTTMSINSTSSNGSTSGV